MTALLCIGECMVEMASTGDANFRMGFAGDSFNTAWHARKILGDHAKVNYFSAVGDDNISQRMLDFMAQQKIGTDFIARRKAMRPGLYTIELNQAERSFTYWREASAARTLGDDAEALDLAMAQHDAIYFSGITLAILPPKARATLLAALKIAAKAGKTIAFDSNLRPKLWPDAQSMRDAIKLAAAVTTLALPTIPDESELFGEPDAASVAARYQAAGVSEVVVKAGANPAQLFWSSQHASVAAAPVVAVDTTGAGDSFNGAYIASRLQGLTPVAAAAVAHGRAAQVIQQYGALDLNT